MPVDLEAQLEKFAQRNRNKGVIEGRFEGILEVAYKMKQKGTSIADIIELTELPYEVIESL